MAGLFNRIFRPGKKRELEFSDQRSSFQRNEGFAEASGGLKSSMRRKGRVYEDDPLVNPTAPYHYDIQPQRQRVNWEIFFKQKLIAFLGSTIIAAENAVRIFAE